MLTPKKFLGQNFLQDENIARKIANSLRLQTDDVAIEIGSGKGALTKYLHSHVKRLIAIEVDERAIKILRETFGETIDLVHSDVLEVPLTDFAKKFKTRLRVVGNIPYYITSEILFWLFDNYEAVNDATIMVQLEVARRFVAQPRSKEYGILSVFSQFYAEPELLFKVSRNSFYPKPNVDSAVVRFTFKRKLPECDLELFRSAVRATFGKRRKTLRNGLRYMGFTEEQLERVEFDLTKRPEDLSLEQFLVLSKLLEPHYDKILNPKL